MDCRRAYIQRLLDELDDHITDLHDERNRHMKNPENKAADGIDGSGTPHGAASADILNLYDHLGDPAQLAAFAAKQYHHRSFLGRHPILTFLVMPLPFALLLMITLGLTCYMAIQAIAWLIPQSMQGNEVSEFIYYNQHPLMCNLIKAAVGAVFTIFPPLLAALFFCRIARRNSCSNRWSLAACVLIAIWAGAFFFKCAGPTRPGNGMMMVGITIWPFDPNFLLLFIPKFALASAIGLLLIKRAQRLQKIEENRLDETMLRQAA